MFKNHSIQMKLVNADKAETMTEGPKTTPAEYAALATEAGKNVVKGAVVILGAYIAMDTLRQVTVQNTKFNKN